MADSNDRSFDENVQSGGGDNTDQGGQGASFDRDSQQGQKTNGVETSPNQGGSDFQRQISVLEKRVSDKDSFIETLKGERQQDAQTIDELKRQIEQLEERSKSVEEVLERMRSSQDSSRDDKPQLAPDEVEKLAEKAYERKKSEEVQTRNLEQIKHDLWNAYGREKVDERISEIASKVDMSFDEAFDMARTRPSAFRKLFLPNEKPSEPSSPTGGVHLPGGGQSPRQKDSTPFVAINSERERIARLQEKFASKSQSA